MYVCETHPTALQPEPNFITNHFNCVCSRLAGATNQPDIQTQTGSSLRACAPHETVYALKHVTNNQFYNL